MNRKSSIRKKYANKFTVLVIASLLLTLAMSRPANSLVMVEYKLPLTLYGLESRPRDIIAQSQAIIFTEDFAGRIGVIDTTVSPHVITEYILPSDIALGSPEPWSIAKSPDGYIWFTDNRLNRIGRMLPDGNGFAEWVIPTSASAPRGIAVNETGDVWFTEFQSGKLGSFDPTGNLFVEWQLPNAACQPNDVIVLGDTVYFTEYAADRIGAYNVTSQYLKEFKLPSGSGPWSLVADTNGMIWFTCSGRNVIGVLNPYTGDVTEHRSIPTDSSQPRGIAFDNVTGEVWFTEYAGHKITKYVQSQNVFFEYPTLTGGSAPNDVAVWRSIGNSTSLGVVDVWFTEFAGNRIGQISQGGPIGAFGTTFTTTVTTLTSAVSATYTAGSSSTTTTRAIAATVAVGSPLAGASSTALSGTLTTSAVRTDTAYRLSTSTYGTSTSFIVEVQYTSTTSISTSTTYVSTVSVTSSVTNTSVSTSYIGTTSITTTTTSFITVNTGTVSRTSTSTVSIPNTLTTVVTFTSYKSTTSGTTTTTSTSTVNVGSISTTLTTVPTTITKTTTSSKITTSYTIPPLPSCIIASAAYGSPLSPQVQALRNFRDGLVLKTFAGSQFMKAFNAWYYSFSPSVANVVSNSSSLAFIVRALIYPLIGILQAATAVYALFRFNPELGVTITGLLASSLIGLVYHTPWITPLLIALKKKRGFEMKMRHLAPFAGTWVISLILIGIAGFLLAPTLMMLASAAFVLLTLGLSATITAALIARKLA
jgi:virginiamycin B lyase